MSAGPYLKDVVDPNKPKGPKGAYMCFVQVGGADCLLIMYTQCAPGVPPINPQCTPNGP
jgi:hypothetical protein